MIDGIADGVPGGTVYKVKINDDRQVWWEVASSETVRPFAKSLHQHTYTLVGSSMDSVFLDMKLSKDSSNLWTAMFAIGTVGSEDFQVVRDRDREQTLYPSE